MSDIVPLYDIGLLADTRDVLVERWHVKSDAGSDWNILLEALAERILGLLRDNPDRLYSALYVLDISEKVTREAMNAPSMQDKACALAKAILDRETQKIATRRKYSAPSQPVEIEGPDQPSC
jgi:hypothetical protein